MFKRIAVILGIFSNKICVKRLMKLDNMYLSLVPTLMLGLSNHRMSPIHLLCFSYINICFPDDLISVSSSFAPHYIFLSFTCFYNCNCDCNCFSFYMEDGYAIEYFGECSRMQFCYICWYNHIRWLI